MKEKWKRKENEDVIIDFLNEFDFEVKREQDIESICGVDGANGITLKPSVFDSDGFYMCKLKRK